MRCKKSLFVLIILIVMTAILLTACSDKTEDRKLSEFEDQELLEYIADAGVSLPEELNMDASKLREMIVIFEENPDNPLVVSYTVLADFSEEIRGLVIEYYGMD